MTDETAQTFKDRDTIVKNNQAFHSYYAAQGICKDDNELEELLETLRKPLPAAFRFNWCADLLDASKAIVTGCDELETIPWYPKGLAVTWKELSRLEIRRNDELSDIKATLLNEATRGAITRQELVSMIPPLVMQLDHSTDCVDMCAAPGSKTSEILDLCLMSAGSDNSKCQSLKMHDSCAILANDSSLPRARLLRHQLQRLSHPGVVVSNGDASHFPSSTVPEGFARILCDVPCSGDGTLRKNIAIWKTWTANVGLGLHSRQLQILERGLRILRPGGRLVYSTCSLNPIENEAVVAAGLVIARQQLGMNVELIPFFLPGAEFKPGLTNWKVPVSTFVSRHRGSARRRMNKTGSEENATCDSEAPASEVSADSDLLSPESTVPPSESAVPPSESGLPPSESGVSPPESGLPPSEPGVPSSESGEGSATKSLTFYESLDAFLAERGTKKSRAAETMFPEYYKRVDEEGIAKQLATGCARFHPHLMNSGGFFVATFARSETDVNVTKRSRVDFAKENVDPASGANVEANELAQKSHKCNEVKKNSGERPLQDLFVPVFTTEDPQLADVVEEVISFYGLSEKVQPRKEDDCALIPGSARRESEKAADGPQHAVGDIREGVEDELPLICRKGTVAKLYLATKRAREVGKKLRGFKVISVGIMSFDKLDERFAKLSGCQYRLCHEGLPWIHQLMRRRLVYATYNAMSLILTEAGSRETLLNLEACGEIAQLDSCRRPCKAAVRRPFAGSQESHSTGGGHEEEGENAYRISSEQTHDGKAAEDAAGTMLLEAGGCLIVASDEFERSVHPDTASSHGIVRAPCVITSRGNVIALVRKDVKKSLLRCLENRS